MQSNAVFYEDQFIRKPELLGLAGLSKSHQNRLELCGQFPQRIRLGKRCIGWSLREVREWMDQRKSERT